MITYTKKEIAQFMDGLDTPDDKYLKDIASNLQYFSYDVGKTPYDTYRVRKLHNAALIKAFVNQINNFHNKILMYCFELLYKVPLKKIPLYLNPTHKDIRGLDKRDFFPRHKLLIGYIVRFRLKLGK